jgi:bifunctional DNA-binding transcriptional regulator/antitoxin component of YhaV-PrlF toxin-antitoxin module
MKAINYTAKVLPDGHISLPHEIKEAMGLVVNSVVKITLEKDVQKENAMKAFGIWSERSEIKGGIEYVEDIRSGWDKRTKRIDNV